MGAVKYYPRSKSTNFYYYLDPKDFAIVWTNVAVFVVGHAIYLYMFYDFIIDPVSFMKMQLYCKMLLFY